MNKKGVSLVELLIVIVVLGIIAGFATAAVVKIVQKQRIGVDSYNVRFLNEITVEYSEDMGVDVSQVFNGVNTDEDRMEALVTNGYLFTGLKTAQSGASFVWNNSTNEWELEGGEYNAISGVGNSVIDFSVETVTDVQDMGAIAMNMGNWSSEDEYMENSTGQTRIFIPISKSTYTVEVVAQLTEGTRGGYGVFFHSTLRDENAARDDGYVFQFDRGYGTGAMIVRKRTNGRESSPVWRLNATSPNATFPEKTVDPDWWTEKHTVKIVVTNVDANTCNAAFYLDGELLGDMDFDNEVAGEQIYTGFRGWDRSPTKYYSLDIK